MYILRIINKQSINKNLLLIWAMLKRCRLLCLIAVIGWLFSGCAMTIPLSASGSRSLLQPEIDRFEQIQGLSCSEIPELYDISRLKAGSTVKMSSIYDKSTKPFFQTTILRDIQSTKTGKQYIVDWVIGKDIYTLEGDSLAFSKVICFDKINYTNYVKTGPDSILDVIHKGGLLYPLTMWGVSKQVAQGLREQKIETKILDFKLISHERLIIANQSISCKVYQIQTITRRTIPSMKKVAGYTLIIDESIKLWISDDVPFGSVKREGSQALHAGFAGRGSSKGLFGSSQEMTESCEVIEFKY